MALWIGVDVGGTFTDFFVWDPDQRASRVFKIASTPNDPSEAILEGLSRLAADGVDVAALDRFAHGTTVATNALIQRTGSRLAVVTTKGFRDLLEIGRQIRPFVYDLQRDAPPPLAPRELRFEVDERVGPDGRVITPLTEAEIGRLADEIAAAAAAPEPIEAVAVCLLFSFLAPEHEQRLAEALRARAPALRVSISSEVQPEFREYERLSTTVLNAYLARKVSLYIAKLKDNVQAQAPTARLGVNQSSGGLMSAERAERFPIRTALSGPAAGVVGAVDAAQRSGLSDVITLDMGGTSTDVCLIQNGAAAMTVGREVAGFPVRLPAIDIHTVGAGGGSIADFGPDGLLKVGPASAGSQPGPAAYGRGGAAATVTDANLVLGRLPERLAGGGMALDHAAARHALAPIARRLGVSEAEAALGIVRIVNANMVGALRAVSVERGHDPRAFALMPFGGAGGLHAVELARALGMRQILAPRAPGILCAQGLLVSDLKESFVATARAPLDGDLAPVRRALAQLAAEAEAWWRAEAIPPERRDLQLALDMRYVGQNYELPVALEAPAPPAASPATLSPDSLSPDSLSPEAVTPRFFAAHERVYGHFDPDAAVEIINVRAVAIGRTTPPELSAQTASGGAAPARSREIWFDAAGPATSAVWDRDALRPGMVIDGPAVVEQLDATNLIPPGARARVDDALNLIIEAEAP